MERFSKELPRDSVGQKTTAVLKESVSAFEWVTPIHITNGDAIKTTVTFPDVQNVKDADILAKLVEVDTELTAINTKLAGTLLTQVTNPTPSGSVTGPIEVSNFPATQAVSGTVSVGNFPATQNVADADASTKLGAIDAKLAGTIQTQVTNAITGSVTVSNLPATQTISGAVSISNLPNIQKVALDSANLILPIEVRGSKRDFLFTATSNLGANGVFFSPVYDGSTVTKLSGFVSASIDGTLYIQESDDQVAWYTTSSQAIVTAGSNVISSVTYYTGTVYEKTLSARYVRLVYVNGATAQTRFALSAYTSI